MFLNSEHGDRCTSACSAQVLRNVVFYDKNFMPVSTKLEGCHSGLHDSATPWIDTEMILTQDSWVNYQQGIDTVRR